MLLLVVVLVLWFTLVCDSIVYLVNYFSLGLVGLFVDLCLVGGLLGFGSCPLLMLLLLVNSVVWLDFAGVLLYNLVDLICNYRVCCLYCVDFVAVSLA